MAFQAVLVVNGMTFPVTCNMEKAYTKVGQKGPYSVLPAQVYGTLPDGTRVRASFAFILKANGGNGKAKAKAAKAAAPAPVPAAPPALKVEAHQDRS